MKFATCGRISKILKMIHMVEFFGLQIMIGYFFENSFLSPTSVHLIPLIDCANLDSILSIKKDPYQGVEIE